MNFVLFAEDQKTNQESDQIRSNSTIRLDVDGTIVVVEHLLRTGTDGKGPFQGLLLDGNGRGIHFD